MPQPLLVPLDGSPLGEAALPWAACLARARGLSVVLARVIRWPFLVADGMTGAFLSTDLYAQIVDDERQAATAYLDPLRRRLADEGLEVSTSIREGEPTEELLDLADELGAYAIVMATRGRGGLARLANENLADRVLQHATVPVLLVRARDDEPTEPAAPPTLGRLLVPLDGSPLAERALDVALEVATPDATLVVMRAVPVDRDLAAGRTTLTVVDEEETQRVAAEAEEYLRGVRDELARDGRSVEVDVRVGETGEEILAAADERATDLIVMATHGRTGPARWLLGSVADQVVRHSECPVLLVSARVLAARVVGAYTVRDLMVRDLATVREDEPLSVALRKLLRRRVSGAPVVNAAGDLVGVLAEHDLLEWQARLIDALSEELTLEPSEYARRLEIDTVGQVMSHPAMTIDESTPLSAALHLFRERRFRRLPVTREGRLVGILARADVLRAMAAQWQATVGDGSGPGDDSGDPTAG
jgi:nucleotide-binding universal stress UspA family protein/predicted transcriptional regulator